MVGTEVLRTADVVLDAKKAMDASHKAAALSARDHISQTGGMTLNAAKGLTAEQKRARYALEIEAKQYAPTAVDKTIGFAGSISSALSIIPFFGLGALNIVGKGIGWVGKKAGVKGVETAGGKISAPAEWLNKNDFSTLGQKMGIGETAGRVSQAAADGTAKAAETLGVQRFVGNRMQGKAYGKAHRHFLDAKKHAEKIDLSALPADMRTDFEVIHEHMSGAANVGEIESHLRKTASVAAPVEVAAGAAGAKEFAEATKAAKPTLSEAIANAEKHMEAITAKGSTVSREAAKDFKKMLGSTGKMTDAIGHVGGWSNVGKSIRDVPGKLAKAPIAHTMMNGAFVAGSAVSMAADARSAQSQLRMVKEMYADMTGQSAANISIARVLLGSVPEPVARARKALVGQYFLKGAADTANIIINTKQAINHKFSIAKAMIGFLGAEAVSHVADGMVADHTAETYVAFKQAYLASKATGQPLEAAQYAEFIGMVSPELAKRGGGRSRFAQEIGTQYAEAGLDPAAIMKEIASGKLMARVHGIIEKTEQAKAAEPKAVSHAASIRGDVAARTHRPVVGKHTHDVVAADQTGLQPGRA